MCDAMELSAVPEYVSKVGTEGVRRPRVDWSVVCQEDYAGEATLSPSFLCCVYMISPTTAKLLLSVICGGSYWGGGGADDWQPRQDFAAIPSAIPAIC